jgi:hypothetical protein
MRKTVKAVKALTPAPGDSVTLSALSAHLQLDKGAVSRRTKRALRGGWLVNDESRSRQPAKLCIGDRLPEERPALPVPENVFTIPSRNSATECRKLASGRGKWGISGHATVRQQCATVQVTVATAQTRAIVRATVVSQS